MKAEFTAIIEAAPEGGFWAICPEVPGANGQGEMIDEVRDSLRQAIETIPRHNEIKEPLAKKILKNFNAE
ncbi:MAG: type II toxin-antitoxin system HicB family antitoxin [Desulfotignum sp.]|nr:type II toxin-antitoxin system HicB family antitoxin [Desulfotignum sp.]